MTLPSGMVSSLELGLAHYLLAGAILATWLPPLLPISVTHRWHWQAWPLVLIAALATGVASGVLNTMAAILVTAMALLLWVGSGARGTRDGIRRTALALGVLAALAFALHKVPGFARGLVILPQRLTPDAAEYFQYLNFDKGVAGLLLLALLCKRAQDGAEWFESVVVAVVVTWFTVAIVVPVAMLSNYLDFAPKVPAVAGTFLFVNLFFTCVAEEAFFRGVLQEKLHQWCERSAWCSRGPQQRWVPILIVLLLALPFGVAHTPSSLAAFVFIFVASVSYGLAYLRTRRIEASILAHFFVNATHFLLFTYPYKVT